jgi:O-antigen ligase
MRDVALGYYFMSRILYVFIIMFFVSSVTNAFGIEVVEIMFHGIVVLTMLATAYSLCVYFKIIPDPDWNIVGVIINPNRVQGFAGNPNAFGTELCMAGIYLIYRIGMPANIVKKSGYMVAVAVVLVALVCTYSRSAWAMAVFSVSAYSFVLLMHRQSVSRFIRFLIDLVGVIILITLCWDAIEVLGYYDYVAQKLAVQNYDQERFLVNQIMWDRSFDHIFGAGPGQSLVYLSNFYNNLETAGAIHNTYLRILYESGFIGVAAYVTFIIYVGYSGLQLSVAPWRLSKISAMVTVLFIAMALNSMVVDMLFSKQFWMVAGMISGLQAVFQRHGMRQQGADLEGVPLHPTVQE